jgi:hypothetical protein
MNRSEIILSLISRGYHITQGWVEENGNLIFRIDIYGKQRNDFRCSSCERFDIRGLSLCVDIEHAMRTVEEQTIQRLFDKMVEKGVISINNH